MMHDRISVLIISLIDRSIWRRRPRTSVSDMDEKGKRHERRHYPTAERKVSICSESIRDKTCFVKFAIRFEELLTGA
eukprot:scaffold26047_cov55-Attheya_sp.AAC.6